MFEKFRLLRGKRSRPFFNRRDLAGRAPRSRRGRLRVERLELRVVPTLFLWVGGTVAERVNFASDSSNWWLMTPAGTWGATNGALPGSSDGVFFAAGAVARANDPIPGKPCVWDAAAPPEVNNVTIGGTYQYDASITLNRDLTVDSSVNMTAIGSSIIGKGDLTMAGGTFTWQGGTLGGSGLLILADGSLATMNATGPSANRTLAGRQIDVDYTCVLNWDRAGPLSSPPGQNYIWAAVGCGGEFNITSAGNRNLNGGGVTVDQGGVLNFTGAAANPLVFGSDLWDVGGSVNINGNMTLDRDSWDSGTITIATQFTLTFGDTFRHSLSTMQGQGVIHGRPREIWWGHGH
jgi:hypothetical protein